MNKGRYTTILWDVDDTLLDFALSERNALIKSFQAFNLEIDDSIINRYSQINIQYWKKLELGEVSKEEVLIGRFRTLFEELEQKPVSITDFQKDYQYNLAHVYFYKDESKELCIKLKDSCRQYLVTNGVSYTQRTKLHLAGFDLIMDDIFVSEEIGVPKPSVDFFHKCFEKIPEFDREKTIIVGDSLSSDMLGGNNARIATCWYNPSGLMNNTKTTIDYQIQHLWQILDII